MPLRVPANLLFASSESTEALGADAMRDMIALGLKIQSPHGRKHVLETFKEHFARASGQTSNSSSSVTWAETDLLPLALAAAESAPGFIAGFFNACEELEAQGGTVPGEANINSLLARHGCHYHIDDGALVVTAPHVASPTVPLHPDEVVARALTNAAALLGQDGAASAIDRTHTALHGYLRKLCVEAGIDTPSDATAAKFFKLLRQDHPALQPSGPRAKDITRVLQALATVIDALSPIRNNASLVHPNPLLEEPEAAATLNATRTLLNYVQASILRHSEQDTE